MLFLKCGRNGSVERNILVQEIFTFQKLFHYLKEVRPGYGSDHFLQHLFHKLQYSLIISDGNLKFCTYS